MARRFGIRPRTVLVTAGIALTVVVGYDWYKHNMGGPVGGARPGTVAP